MKERISDAVVFRASRQIEIGHFPLAQIEQGDIVVQTLYTMVSSGTELRVLSGYYGAAEKYPLVPGYSVVGRVVEVGSEAKGWKVGDLVSAGNPKPLRGINAYWGGQAAYHVYPTDGEQPPVLLPEGANPLDYIIAEIGAISWRGVEACAPQPGETAVVIGQGLIGALSAAWFRMMGCRVIVADRMKSRLQRATRWSSAVVDASEDNVAERIHALCPQGADTVVETSGSTPGVNLAYSLVRPRQSTRGHASGWPRLLMQANYLEPVAVNPHSFFEGEGVVLLTPMDRRVQDRQKVAEFLRAGKIRASDFVDSVVPFREAPSAYARLRDEPDECFSLVFDWTESNSA